jgi:hypothetical protein
MELSSNFSELPHSRVLTFQFAPLEMLTAYHKGDALSTPFLTFFLALLMYPGCIPVHLVCIFFYGAL